MARIETDPNYTTPTFSRATAATDLFKKEDVQGVAAALSTHVHDGVHGLPLSVAGSIPGTSIAVGGITSAQILDKTILGGDIADGTIGSLQIGDGAIQGVDIADNNVQWRNFHNDGRLRYIGSYSTLLSWSTSGAGWVATPITVTLGVASHSHKHLLVQFSTSIAGNTAGNGVYTALGWNGSGPYTVGQFSVVPVANYVMAHGWMTYVSPASSFTTFGIYVNGGGALVTISNAAVTALNVWEVFMP